MLCRRQKVLTLLAFRSRCAAIQEYVNPGSAHRLDVAAISLVQSHREGTPHKWTKRGRPYAARSTRNRSANIKLFPPRSRIEVRVGA